MTDRRSVSMAVMVSSAVWHVLCMWYGVIVLEVWIRDGLSQ